jgi:hypothetical protein
MTDEIQNTAEAPDATVGKDGAGEDLTALRKEAAKYRTRAKEAEAERDKLVEQLTGFHRAEVERIASTGAEGFRPLADGADLWNGDAELSTLVAEDGTVDAGAVRERAAALGESRPHYRAPGKTAGGNADQGRGDAPKEDPRPSFGEALKGA